MKGCGILGKSTAASPPAVIWPAARSSIGIKMDISELQNGIINFGVIGGGV